MPLSVLYVCAGNVCRSPMAELLLRAWLPSGTDVEVSSAGTQALVGHGIDRSTASALGQLGIDPSRHRARQFEPWMAADADLILTAEHAQRDLVMTALPAVFRRTFTMKEFARLARHITVGSPPSVIAEAAAIRGIDGAVPVEVDNMPDPYRGRIRHAKSIAEQVSQTVRVTLGVFELPRPDADSLLAVAQPRLTPHPSPQPRVNRPRPKRSP